MATAVATKAGSIVQDEELKAMNKIAKTLNALPPAERARVTRWIWDKYRVQLEEAQS